MSSSHLTGSNIHISGPVMSFAKNSCSIHKHVLNLENENGGSEGGKGGGGVSYLSISFV